VDPAVLLWDFGDTLVDERWMRRPPELCPAWPEVWVEAMEVHADDWNDGTIGRAEVFASLAERSGMSVADVETHARECCARLEFYRNAWRTATERRFRQALVTVNPDIFEEWLVPEYHLGTTFDAIVISSVERTNDKTELCDIALQRLGSGTRRSDALLIDNRLDLIEAWREAGGLGYWFRDDDQFARDLPDLFP
jgi:FMN phosphatase YigB (HAD superfamily)